jgi:NADPH:quinone reductase
MKAVIITRPGGPEVLELRDLPRPVPQGEQVLVRVRAAGVNRADLSQTRGHYPAPAGSPADIPGLEFAGEIEALGPTVSGALRIGDRVFGIVGGGAYADYVVTHERMAVPIPVGLDFETAAAVPEAFITAHDALETQGCVKPGERVLIHAVGGGVGSAAVQVAHAMGCMVFGTSRTAEKLARCAEIGLDIGIHTSQQDFASVVQQQTGGEGVHVVVDHLGGGALASNLAALAVRGRLVVVGLLAGSSAPLDFGTLMHKRISIIGTVLRARPLEEKIAVTRSFTARVVPWITRGQIKPVIDEVFEIADVRAAHERMAANTGFGKVILRI